MYKACLNCEAHACCIYCVFFNYNIFVMSLFIGLRIVADLDRGGTGVPPKLVQITVNNAISGQ